MSGSWSMVASEVMGSRSRGSARTWYGWVLGCPRKNLFRGRALTLTRVAVPGSATAVGGLSLTSRLSSGSSPTSGALKREFPLLST